MTAKQIMREALSEAKKAAEAGEIPVGAVIVRHDDIIARAYNERERTGDPTAHAEILSMRKAAEILGDWRLNGCTLYVTLEPCCMCSGAIIAARLPRLVFGANDLRFGGCGGAFDLTDGTLGWTCHVVGGVLENECAALLRQHFQKRRMEKA